MQVHTAFSRPLEEYRQMAYETRDEFATRLGISAQTYRKLLRGGDIDMPLKRQIARLLGLQTPALIIEFGVRPSASTLAAYDADIEAANTARSWQVFDLESGSFTPDATFSLASGEGE
jgi:DNA-binding XRE family transcriptional regulator